MSVSTGNDFELALRTIGRAWAWLLAFGIISIIAGLAAIFWPGPTLLVIAIVFAVQLIVGGVFRFVGAFAIPGETGWLRALQAFLAILSFAVGLFLVGHLVLSLLVLAIVLGVYWVVHGVIELFVAIGHAELPGRVWMIVSGILGIVAGAILIVAPGLSLFALTIVLGVWLVLFGAILAVQA
ncbi:MAG TPA: DUF308 domain-containing protein, partial [Candidatus Dormibacteraeota bacterium]